MSRIFCLSEFLLFLGPRQLVWFLWLSLPVWLLRLSWALVALVATCIRSSDTGVGTKNNHVVIVIIRIINNDDHDHDIVIS